MSSICPPASKLVSGRKTQFLADAAQDGIKGHVPPSRANAVQPLACPVKRGVELALAAAAVPSR